MDATDIALLILAALSAVFLGTLAEYFVHRLMHWGILYPEGHKYHHESNDPRTYLSDFFDYGTGAVLTGWLGFLISFPAGIGWAMGAVGFSKGWFAMMQNDIGLRKELRRIQMLMLEKDS